MSCQHLSPADAERLRLCCSGAARSAVGDLGLHARLGTDYDKVGGVGDVGRGGGGGDGDRGG